LRNARNVRGLVTIVAVASAVRLINVVWLHPINFDEIEFFRATEWVRQGLVPFRGFWEHHMPLQWFLFAPVAALTSSVDGHAIVAMRIAQIPAWIATFWLMFVWMRDARLARFGRWAAAAVAVSSSFLMIAAVEYRVDVAGCLFYACGLVLLQRMRARPPLAFAAGAMFALAGLANLRLGPLLALTVLLARVVDTREAKWGGAPAANWIFAGVVAVLGLFGVYCVATHSLGDVMQHVWTENYLGDRYADVAKWRFVHRLLLPSGFRIITNGTGHFDIATVDLAGIALLALGAIGVARSLRNWRTPDDRFFLATLMIANLMFIAVMKVVYNYHFEIVVVMLLPFIAAVFERIGRERTVIALLAVCALASCAATIFRGKGEDRAYQDFIMREADRRTAPGDRVWDGVGWAIRRQPAYRYWFLPELVRQLEQRGILQPPYDASQAMSDPPAAVIADFQARAWLNDHPRLKSFVVTHYLPRWPELWLPAMNARLTPASTSTDWIVPADGLYRIFAAPSLAAHPWFHGGGQAEVWLPAAPIIIGATLRWSLNGVAREAAGGVLELRRNDRLRVMAATPQPLGIFLVPGDDQRLFRQPQPGVTLDSLALRTTHLPSFAPFDPR
jgi:hypothetical protein